VRAARNIAIILLLALIVDLVPGGGNAAQAIIAAVGIIFLAMIAWSGYVFYRENRLAYLGLTDRQRAMLLGGLGAIALMIAGASKLTATSGGTLILIAIVVGAVLAIVKVWTEYRSLY
jgi:prepilin signal peptidase PulO-like enzyme (type II secretory pathway)